MSSKPPDIFDIVIVGGGFSALSALAHLVRFAQKPLSVRVIASEGFESFGPAYATPRDEHLLNVRAIQMGLYEGDSSAFLESMKGASPDDYLPRKSFGRFLSESLTEIYREAETKKIVISVVRDIVTDISRESDLTLSHGSSGKTLARQVLLATGNSFPTADKSSRHIENVWHFDFSKLPSADETIAVIGSGLTAVDVIISLHATGWKGKILCYSGNGRLPRPHPASFEKQRVPVIDAVDFKGLRLSSLLRKIRRQVKESSGGQDDYAYVFYALRPYVPDIWRSLSVADQKRALSKYLWLWNIYRHRYAARLDAVLQDKIRQGTLMLKRGKVISIRDAKDHLALEIKTPSGKITQQKASLAFRCVGPSYLSGTQPLIKKMLAKNLVHPHATGFGLAAQDGFSVAENILAIGPLLFGEYLETTAVPELRAQAAKAARLLLDRL